MMRRVDFWTWFTYTRTPYLLGSVCAALLVGQLALGQNAPGGQKLPGQTPGGAINQGVFNAGSPAAGFAPTSLTPALSVPATSTAQAKFSTNGNVISGTVITTATTIITGCPAGAGVTLPAVTAAYNIVIMNRSGSACNIWPTLGASVEQLTNGQMGLPNAPFAMPSTGDYGFRAISATQWLH